MPGREILMFSALSFGDLYVTRYLSPFLDHVELNPIADAWLDSYGWNGLAAYKLMTVLLVMTLVGLIACYRPATAKKVLRFACLATSAVVLYGVSMAALISYIAMGIPS